MQHARSFLRLFALPAAAALALVVTGACSSSSEEGGTDKCCPISEPPTSCNTAFMGGSRAKNPSCGAFQDNIPPLARTVDEDGCPKYVIATAQTGAAVPYANDCPKRDASSDAPAE